MDGIKEVICDLLRDICRKICNRNFREDVLDHIYFSIERAEHVLNLASQTTFIDERIFPLLSEAKSLIANVGNNQHVEFDKMCFQSATTQTGTKGRPRYFMTKEQLEYFILKRQKWLQCLV